MTVFECAPATKRTQVYPVVLAVRPNDVQQRLWKVLSASNGSSKHPHASFTRIVIFSLDTLVIVAKQLQYPDLY